MAFDPHTTFLTWPFSVRGAWVGCGIDAEAVERFARFDLPTRPRWRYVYTDDEDAHNAALPTPSEGYCVGFCCKEAFLKAVSQPVRFSECTVFTDPSQETQTLHLRGSLAQRFTGHTATSRVMSTPWGETVTVVNVLKDGDGVAEGRMCVAVIEIAAVERGRATLLAAHFGEEECTALAQRKAQTVAGFLAAKRALVHLIAPQGASPEIVERDFRLAHRESGAPYLVELTKVFAMTALLPRISIAHTRTRAYGLAVVAAPFVP